MLDSDKPCKFRLRHKVEGSFVLDNNEADISGDEGIVMKQVDEGAVESDTSGTSSYSNNTK